MPAGLPEEVQAYMNYQFDPSTFTETVIAGFTFNEEPVKTEIAMCAPIVDKYIPVLLCGLFDDAEEELNKFGEELRAAGVDKIKEELKNQLNDFLANK